VDKERKLIIAGNWKMNKTVAEGLDLVNGIKRELKDVKEVDIVVCPPFTALGEVSKAILDSNIRLGAQNMSEHNSGAYTGEIAAGMLKEFSTRYVILGHSERRQYQKESDELISKKAAAAHAASLKPIVCVGETLAEREGGQMESVLLTQVRGSLAGLSKQQMEETIVAYEPVWAIGTGKTASAQQAQDAHAYIRSLLVKLFDDTVARRVRIQYGGSVKPSNARELMGRRSRGRCFAGRPQLRRHHQELDLTYRKESYEHPHLVTHLPVGSRLPRPDPPRPHPASQEGSGHGPGLWWWRDGRAVRRGQRQRPHQADQVHRWNLLRAHAAHLDPVHPSVPQRRGRSSRPPDP
jgi:triosephosphate isomerase